MPPPDTSTESVPGEMSTVILAAVAGFFINVLLLSLVLGEAISLLILGLILAAAEALLAAQFYRSPRLALAGRAVLITGCDTGFGNKLARTLDAMGVKVFAACLTKSQGGDNVKTLEKECSSNLITVQMDISKQDEVDEAFTLISREMGEQGLWGLVNNAGISTFGDVEWCTMDTYHRLMDVNVWGAVRVTKKFLPLIRREKGRVVTMVSGLGRMTHAGRSAYGMSKYATEAFCDALRYETRKFGVKVSIITPGNFMGATGIITAEGAKRQADSMWEAADLEVRNAYGGRKHLDHSVNAIKSFMKQSMPDISPVVNAYVAALQEKTPRKRYYPTGLYYRVKIFLMTHLPEGLAERIYM